MKGRFSFGQNCAVIQVMIDGMKLSLQRLQSPIVVLDTTTMKTLLSQPLFEYITMAIVPILDNEA